jgi:hypothetical protein
LEEAQARRIVVEENKEMRGWKSWRKRGDAWSKLKKELLRSGRDRIGIKSSMMDGVTSFMK